MLSQLAWAQKNEIAFTIPEKDLIPEGITFDGGSKSFFVGSIAKRKIVQINAGKKISDFAGSRQHGLGEVLGMYAHQGSLWVCSNIDAVDVDSAKVHQFDISSQKLVRKWVLVTKSEKHLFNDLVVLNDGCAIVTDTDANQLYQVDGSATAPVLFLQDAGLRYINGITKTADENYLMVSGLGGFLKIDPLSKAISSISFDGFFLMGTDGLYWHKQSLIAIQNITYPTTINQYFINADFDKVSSARVLASDQPGWNIPTTGVIVDNWFYYIGNSQITNFENGQIKVPSMLKNVVIMRVSIK